MRNFRRRLFLLLVGCVLVGVVVGEKGLGLKIPLTTKAVNRCGANGKYSPLFCNEVGNATLAGAVAAVALDGVDADATVAAWDAAAAGAYETLQTTLARRSCSTSYSLGSCKGCLRAYRRWLCSRLALCTAWDAGDTSCDGQPRCKTQAQLCDTLCWDVIRACPPEVREFFSCPEISLHGISHTLLPSSGEINLPQSPQTATVQLYKHSTTSESPSPLSGCFPGWDGGGGGEQGVRTGSVGLGEVRVVT